MEDLVSKSYYYQANIELNKLTANDNLVASSYLGRKQYKYATTGKVINANAEATGKNYFDLNFVLSDKTTETVRTQYSVYDSFGFIGSFFVTVYGAIWLLMRLLTSEFIKTAIVQSVFVMQIDKN